MALSIPDLYNKKEFKLSQEAIQEKLRISKNALAKLNVIKSNMSDRDFVAREMMYVNSVLDKPIFVSKEDDSSEVVTKVGEAEKLVTKVINELTEQHDPVGNADNDSNEEAILPEQQPEPKKEIEPILKYPLNEETLMKYSITTPNLLNVSSVVLTEKGKLINKEPQPASVVSATKELLNDAATRTEFVEICKENYDEKLSLIDNAVRFFNTSSGNRWLLSKEGKRWVNYVLYKHPVSLEEDRIIPEEDLDVFSNEDDEELETLIAMENKNDAAYLESELHEEDDVDLKDEEKTMAELSDNADKITRLENEISLVEAGIENIDDLQANGSISVESAIVYNKVMNKIRTDIASNIGVKDLEEVTLSTESLEYDPVGGLTVTREGLVEILQNIYEFFKKMILKVINWIKKYFGPNTIKSKLVSNKAEKLISKLKSKKELTKEKFDNISTKLLETYRPILFVMDYDISNAKNYLDSLAKSTVRKTVYNPLKEVKPTLDKLNSDLGNSKKEELVKDAKTVAGIMNKDKVISKAFANRPKAITKLDKNVTGKKDKTDILPLFVNKKSGYGLISEETSFGGETLYKYDIQPLTFTTLPGLFNTPPSKADIEVALRKTSECKKDMEIMAKDVDAILNYSKAFIESFKKFKSKSWGDNSDLKDVSGAINSIISYAKAVSIKYATLELTNYLHNSKSIQIMTEQLINAMD